MVLSTWVTPPVIMTAGVILFSCLISTAVVGFLIMKGKANIPFSWHVNLARLTIAVALVHASLAMIWFFQL
jgi:hypothetical protein